MADLTSVFGRTTGADLEIVDKTTNNVLLAFRGTKVDLSTAGSVALPATIADSVADALTAFAGGGQSSALALTKQINRITVVATAADSVKLPASVAGLQVWVINSGANSMQVFGAGTDTINDVATATGVSQLPNSLECYTCSVAGKWYVDIGAGYAGSLLTESTSNAITAFAGGGQASATALTAQTNRVTTVATAADSVKLPASVAGLELIVINSGANAMQVFGAGTDTINDVATATGVSQPANSIEVYSCPVAGKWYVEIGTGFSGSLFTESSSDTITAFAGGGQASATAITTQTARITVVATAGDSVKLPASAPGLELMLINHGANSMQVYGAGSDKIDDIATATGVSQMTNSLVIYTCATAGNWYSEGLATGFGGPGLQTLSFTPTLTAFAGGGQSSAVALPSMMNRVSTVATQGDSVKLPASAVGLAIMVINRGAQPMQVFGAGTDTINGIATATGISQGISTTAVYTCNVAGNWEVPINSLVSSSPTTLSVNGAIPAHVAHTYVITKAGVLADTLAAPTSGTDDGIEITITSNTAFAHTLTATGLLQTGSANVNVATFAAQPGAGLTLMAYGGKWNVLASVGVVFS